MLSETSLVHRVASSLAHRRADVPGLVSSSDCSCSQACVSVLYMAIKHTWSRADLALAVLGALAGLVMGTGIVAGSDSRFPWTPGFMIGQGCTLILLGNKFLVPVPDLLSQFETMVVEVKSIIRALMQNLWDPYPTFSLQSTVTSFELPFSFISQLVVAIRVYDES